MAPRPLSVAHVPHVFVPAPWDTPRFLLTEDTQHHLKDVLRLPPGAPVTYTDGRGTAGTGIYEGAWLVRGEEVVIPAPAPAVTIAVAPPHRPKRARLIVEKLGELGVDRLVWLEARHGGGRLPPTAKSAAWAVAALQQSRGDRLLEIDGPVPVSGPWDQQDLLYVADPSGTKGFPAGLPSQPGAVVLIGPEGGFASDEVPTSAVPISLGPRILRTETAAIVAAAMLVARR